MIEILTDEQIHEKASELFPPLKHMDLLREERMGYEIGWKECQEYYKELIEGGQKWNELTQKVQIIQDQKSEYPGQKADRIIDQLILMQIVKI